MALFGYDSHRGVLEIGEMVISAYIASRVLRADSLLDRLLFSFNPIYYMPHMTSYSNNELRNNSFCSSSSIFESQTEQSGQK